jgi:phosphate regulon transcriptional regulator PhoB
MLTTGIAHICKTLRIGIGYMKILVVDDERDIVDLIAYNLEKEGFSIARAYDGEEALKTIASEKPDLMILDLMLPGVQGLDVCRSIRKDPETAGLPIIMLTAKSDEIDRILGLEIGADDYITKPFSIRELIARVRAVLRRTAVREPDKEPEAFNWRGLRVDYSSYEVTRDGSRLDLSPTEIKLLIFFSKNPGRVFTRGQILDHVWGQQAFVEPRTVDVHIRRLRSQIEKDPENPEFILTVRGVGYKFSK